MNARPSVTHAHDVGDRVADALYGDKPVTPEPFHADLPDALATALVNPAAAPGCVICGSIRPRGCAANTANGESADNCHFMPQPWTPYERARFDKFWAERGDEIAQQLRSEGPDRSAE